MRSVPLRQKLEPFLVTAGIFAFTSLYYTRITAFQIIGFGLVAATTLYWSFSIRYGSRMTARDFKLRMEGFRLQIFLALVLAFVGWFAYNAYLILTRGQGLNFKLAFSLPVALTIIAVASAEEIFFRGYLQNRLGRTYSLLPRVLLAVFALAFYKNVIHMWEGLSLLQHLELFLLGFLFNLLPSFWMERSNSLLGPLLLHVVWDLLVYAPLNAIPYWVF